MTAHAKLSASGAHRWMACPGSVAAENGIPDQTSSFAEEGTKAHDLMEQMLTGKFIRVGAYDWQMWEHVETYTDYVRSLKKPGDTLLVEERVDFSEWVPEGFGTTDTTLIGNGRIHIVDLKYGKGVKVFVKDNPQPLLYALGSLNNFGWMDDITTIRMSIVQPRLDHIDEWEISITDLLKFGEKAREAALATTDPKAKRVPGEKQCRWCKAKATCPALYKLTTDTLMADFDQIDEAPQPHKLTDEQLRAALENRIMIESWLISVENYAKERIVNGDPLPGFKLVEGRSTRRWSDEKEAELALTAFIGPDAFTRKLVSPAQAEKLLGKAKKNLIQNIVMKPKGTPTLAKDSDPRPEITAVAGDFEALDDSENEA